MNLLSFVFPYQSHKLEDALHISKQPSTTIAGLKKARWMDLDGSVRPASTGA
jgi:hypothetical protein